MLKLVRFGPPDTCWDWEGDTNKNDRPTYGSASDGISVLVSRRMFTVFTGTNLSPIVELHHRCLHSWCVNPWHLVPLSREEHGKEHRAKAPPTHCPQGHRLDRKNLGVYERPDGRIRFECKACGRERAAKNR